MIHLPVNGHPSCAQCFLFFVFLKVPPECSGTFFPIHVCTTSSSRGMELLSNTSSILLNDAKLFSKMIVPTDTPTGRVWRILIAVKLLQPLVLPDFNCCQSGGWGFNLHFPDYEWGWQFFGVPYVKCLFVFHPGCFFFLIRLLVFFLLNCRNSVNIQNPPLLVICNANNFPVGRLSFFTMSFDNLFLKRDLSILYGFHFFFFLP